MSELQINSITNRYRVWDSVVDGLSMSLVYTAWGGNYGTDYHSTFLVTPYLASINNLDSAVIKNTDKTMKITYELTEVTE